MKELYELKERLCDELKDYGKKELSPGSLDVIDKLAHSVKNIYKIIDYHEGEEYNGGYSGHYPGEYDGRHSYSRGRGPGASRDAAGRYSGRGYSREYGERMMPEYNYDNMR